MADVNLKSEEKTTKSESFTNALKFFKNLNNNKDSTPETQPTQSAKKEKRKSFIEALEAFQKPSAVEVESGTSPIKDEDTEIETEHKQEDEASGVFEEHQGGYVWQNAQKRRTLDAFTTLVRADLQATKEQLSKGEVQWLEDTEGKDIENVSDEEVISRYISHIDTLLEELDRLNKKEDKRWLEIMRTMDSEHLDKSLKDAIAYLGEIVAQQQKQPDIEEITEEKEHHTELDIESVEERAVVSEDMSEGSVVTPKEETQLVKSPKKLEEDTVASEETAKQQKQHARRKPSEEGDIFITDYLKGLQKNEEETTLQVEETIEGNTIGQSNKSFSFIKMIKAWAERISKLFHKLKKKYFNSREAAAETRRTENLQQLTVLKPLPITAFGRRQKSIQKKGKIKIPNPLAAPNTLKVSGRRQISKTRK